MPKFVFPNLLKISSAQSLFLYAITFFSEFCSNSIRKVLECLVVCKKSLTKEEISISSKVSLRLTSRILHIFDVVLIKHNDLYSFSNPLFRTALPVTNILVLSKEIAYNFGENYNISRIHEQLHALFLSNE